MELKDRIREAMEDSGMKPADLARATGKSPGAVTQWLDGTIKSLKAETAALIQRATGFSSTWLVTGKGEKKQAATPIATQPDTVSPVATLEQALNMVLDALVHSPAQAEIKQLLPMLIDTNAAAYRARLLELLGGATGSPTVDRVIQAKLNIETKDITPQGAHSDAGNRN